MNEKEQKVCVNCNRSDERIPLLTLTYKSGPKYICAQCLPILIHKTWLLADQFPGVDLTPPSVQ